MEEETPQNKNEAAIVIEKEEKKSSPQKEKNALVQKKEPPKPRAAKKAVKEKPLASQPVKIQKTQAQPQAAPKTEEATKLTEKRAAVTPKAPSQEDAFIIINDDTPQTPPKNVQKQPKQKEQVAQSTLSKTKMLQKETKTKKIYAIDIAKIFIRTKPVDGKRVDVWAKGHRFVAGDERDIDGRIWVSIVEDCKQDDTCEKLEKPLWVSKKYIKNINNLSLD